MSSGDSRMEGSGDRRMEDDVPQPRQPRNLQDLVRYSIEAWPSQPHETQEIQDNLTLERRLFLEEALQSLTEDVTKELAEAIATLQKYQSTDEDYSSYESALDIIADRVDNIDCANDFCKLGGFDVVPACLSSCCSGIRWRMCDVIAQCTQNNPFCQEYVVKHLFLESLLNMVDKDPDEKCRTKAFFAVSSVVRDCQQGLKEFLRLDGFSVVLRAMQSPIERLRNKSTFFLSSILFQHPEIIGDVFNMGFVEQLVALIHNEHSPVHEHIISTLLTISKSYTPAQVECRRPELKLRSSLTYLLQQYQHDDAFREEMGYIKELMNLIFSDDSEEER
uniref:Putative armadillo/beta-catenin-like repeat-containing protein n=1 Tax=Rhodnius neglectus TaxID=72488 RepID=A0A0P4VQH4_9HEMI